MKLNPLKEKIATLSRENNGNPLKTSNTKVSEKENKPQLFQRETKFELSLEREENLNSLTEPTHPSQKNTSKLLIEKTTIPHEKENATRSLSQKLKTQHSRQKKKTASVGRKTPLSQQKE